MLFSLWGFHLRVIVPLQLDIIQIEQVIAFANIFFLSNALLCILAAIYLLDSTFLRLSGSILCLGFTVLLFFSSPWILEMMLLKVSATVYYTKINIPMASDHNN